MKPLTPAQQRVVDVMKMENVMIELDNLLGCFIYDCEMNPVNANTANSLINKEVINYSHTHGYSDYYTLSPEYK